jgi:DNA-binding CsgD family transcriptional regulator
VDLVPTLEGLFDLPAVRVQATFNLAADIIRPLLDAESLDLFLYDPSTDTLVAETSDSVIGRLQHASGFDRLPLRAGGLAVKVFQSGGCVRRGQLANEVDERQEIVSALGICSAMICPLNGELARRGVVEATSTHSDQFTEDNLRDFEIVTSWIGMTIRRAELVEQALTDALSEGRRLAAEDLRRLTRREQEIAAFLASGLTNKQIGTRLFLATGTVANHVEHILRKLGFTRRSQIASWTVEHGLSVARSDNKE